MFSIIFILKVILDTSYRILLYSLLCKNYRYTCEFWNSIHRYINIWSRLLYIFLSWDCKEDRAYQLPIITSWLYSLCREFVIYITAISLLSYWKGMEDVLFSMFLSNRNRKQVTRIRMVSRTILCSSTLIQILSF